MTKFAVAAVIGTVLLSACTIKPIPDDVVPDTTPLIVMKIRCEARSAIFEGAKARLLASKSDKDKLFGARLVSGDSLRTLIPEFQRNPSIVEQDTAKRLLLLKDTVMALQFRFDGTVVDDNVINASFGEAFTRRLVFLTLQGGNNRTRENKRVLATTDTFTTIFTNLDDDECEEIRAVSSNWVYPIIGQIGLKETISTFIAIAIEADYGKVEDNSFIDTITFTTKFYGNIEPKITLEAIEDFGLTQASTNPQLSREDVHEVTVALLITPAKANPRQTATRALRDIEREENLEVFRELRDEVQ
jgi:hypothetical protein